MQVDYRGNVAPGKKHIGIRIIPGKTPGNEQMLRPGINTLTAERWSEIEAHPSVQHLVESGELVVLKGEKGGDLAITAMSPQLAADLIKRTTEPGVLEQWRKQLEAKGTAQVWVPIAKLLAKQIEAVTTDANGRPAAQRPLQMTA